MAMYVTDPSTIELIKAQRAITGADKHDEVWDGVYVVSPLANNDHQRLVSRLTTMFQEVLAVAPRGDSNCIGSPGDGSGRSVCRLPGRMWCSRRRFCL